MFAKICLFSEQQKEAGSTVCKSLPKKNIFLDKQLGMRYNKDNKIT